MRHAKYLRVTHTLLLETHTHRHTHSQTDTLTDIDTDTHVNHVTPLEKLLGIQRV